MQISLWRSSWAWPALWFPLALILIGIILRCSGLTHQSLWFDEIASIRMAQNSDLFRSDFHPPLYFSLLKSWIFLFGTSEFAVRLLSALIGIGSLCAVGLVAANSIPSRRAAGVAVLLTSCSFTHLWYSQEVRSYILLFLESTALLEINRRWIANPRSVRLTAMLTGVNTILLYTHYGAALLLCAQGCHVAFLAFRQRRKLYDPEGYIMSYAPVVPGTTLLSVPLFSLLLSQSHHVANGKLWISPPGFRDVYLLLPRLLFYTPGILGQAAIPAVNGFVLIALIYPIITRKGLNLLHFSIILPPALALLLTIFGVQMFVPKVMIIILPAVTIACTQVLCTLPFSVAGVLCLSYIWAQAILMVRYYTTPEKEGWRSAGSFLAAHADTDDTFYFAAPGTRLALEYYYPLSDRQVRGSLDEPSDKSGKIWIIHALTPEPWNETLERATSSGCVIFRQTRASGVRVAGCRKG